MFQNFDETTDPSASHARIRALRQVMQEANFDGYLVPHADEYQGEYIPPASQRLTWLTGFTGSAGIAIVLANTAAIFVDGRYTVQVQKQVDTTLITPLHLINDKPHLWLTKTMQQGQRIGYDPWLHTYEEIQHYKKHLSQHGIKLIANKKNLIDVIWQDRPAPPRSQVFLHPIEFAGKSSSKKIAELQEALAQIPADAVVLTQSDSIAWTFNIRGNDIAHIPIALSFAILRRNARPSLYIDGDKLSNEVRDILHELTDIEVPEQFLEDLASLNGQSILIDPSLTSEIIATSIEKAGGTLIKGKDPCLLPKARKNAAEMTGAQNAHLRDGVAITRFVAWLGQNAPSGTIDEITAAKRLEDFRQQTGRLKDLSFDTISAAGPHAALPHYRVNHNSNINLQPGEIYLVDSGAQYEDGTTDITRTLLVGAPNNKTPDNGELTLMRDRYTRVLRGHIAIATLRFPEGTTGAHIDAFARLFLWQAGLDFDHGTGHGVGSYLSIHEGPVGISKRSSTPLEANMIVSNEPGYYKADAWGIRIENLERVTEPQKIDGGERPMLGFERLTLAPIDTALIDPAQLTSHELQWFDKYHNHVREKIAPLLDEETRQWLIAATEPLCYPRHP